MEGKTFKKVDNFIYKDGKLYALILEKEPKGMYKVRTTLGKVITIKL